MHAFLEAFKPIAAAIATWPAARLASAQRLFHGRGGLWPGCEHITLDWYPPCLVLTSFERVLNADELAAVQVALGELWLHWQAPLAPNTPLGWVYQGRQAGQAPQLQVWGTVPEPHWVVEDGARYRVQLLRGQNHGLFLDMAEGRRRLRAWCAERAAQGAPPRVLNLFAYSGSLSVAALQGGAHTVLNLDMSPGALALARQNHAANGLPIVGERGASAGAQFLAHDVFKSWGKLSRSGPYDLVVADPPSFQKGSFVATKDYARLARRLPDLLAPDGEAWVALNTPKLGTQWLMDCMATHAPGLAFMERVANPPAFADVDAERALKLLRYRRTETEPPATP